MARIVSVPFRGSRSEIARYDIIGVSIPKFPSPFGVHVLKFVSNTAHTTTCSIVSVPFRGSRSEMAVTTISVATPVAAFPSPFGVHVLKLATLKNQFIMVGSFRPLSGFTF